MGAAFHYMINGEEVSSSGGGIIPDPVVLDVNQVLVDGQLTEITATSGELQYLIVEPGDFPLDAMGRELRRGTIIVK
jgi:hypothetical protein